jgi:hypothetical protein
LVKGIEIKYQTKIKEMLDSHTCL